MKTRNLSVVLALFFMIAGVAFAASGAPKERFPRGRQLAPRLATLRFLIQITRSTRSNHSPAKTALSFCSFRFSVLSPTPTTSGWKNSLRITRPKALTSLGSTQTSPKMRPQLSLTRLTTSSVSPS